MIRYAVVILLMASSAFGQDAAQRRGLLFTRSSRTPVAQTAMSVRTTCRCGLDPAMGPSRGQNSQLPRGPPSAHEWLLAPVTMQWFGKSSADICSRRWK
jgi:hypothetical protein